MNLRNLKGLLYLATVMLAVVSCFDDNKNKDVISEEAKVTKFYLSNDSIKELKNYAFVIDNSKMLIYNADSMDYGTDLKCVSPVVSPKFSKAYFNDTINYYITDTLYMDFTAPVKLTVVAADGVTEASYTINANVHQVDPDTFIWKQMSEKIFNEKIIQDRAFAVNEQLMYLAMTDAKLRIYVSHNGDIWNEVTTMNGLDTDQFDLDNATASRDYVYLYSNNAVYSSSDGAVWDKKETTGLNVRNICFYLDGALYGIAETDNGRNAQWTVLKGNEWIALENVPADFPVKGASVTTSKSPSGKDRVFVVGGIDSNGNYLSSVWSTEDGKYWVNMTEKQTGLSERAYCSALQYSGKIWIFGGIDKNGKLTEKYMVYSEDSGIHWESAKNTKAALPDIYIKRYAASAVTTDNGYMYLIGGKTEAGTILPDVWMGLNYKAMPGFID